MPLTKVNSLGITNPVAFSAGTVSLPSITTSGDTNTGAFFPTADTIAFTEGGAESMRINSSGNLIMTSRSSADKGQLQVGITGSTGAANGAAIFIGSSSTAYPIGVKGISTNQGFIAFFDTDDNIVGNITKGGSSTAYNTSSDYRLKENVVYNLNGIERIKLLKPARFNFKTEPNKTIDGFLAHEVSDIVPEAIHGTKDQIDSKGKPVHQGIDQSKLVPLLTGALQEAIAKIESLEARLTALESK
jgi:hypothetical protein